MLQKVSRRKFTHGLMAAGGTLLISRRARAAEFELRQFHNQPADSPLDKWLVANVGRRKNRNERARAGSDFSGQQQDRREEIRPRSIWWSAANWIFSP